MAALIWDDTLATWNVVSSDWNGVDTVSSDVTPIDVTFINATYISTYQLTGTP